MRLELFLAAAWLAGAIGVIVTEPTKWLNGIAVAEAIVGLVVGLLAADYLRLPWPNAELWLAGAGLIGWCVLALRGTKRATTIIATAAGVCAAELLLLELGWLRVDALRRLFR